MDAPGAPPRLFRLSTPILAGAIAVLTTLVLLAWIHHTSTLQLLEATRWVERTRDSLEELEATLSSLKDAEAGQRGYLLTGEPEYLQPYERAVAGVRGHLDRLRSLAAGDPQREKQLDAFRSLTGASLDDLAQTIRLFASGDSRAARRAVAEGSGERLMDGLRQAADQVRADEKTLLARRASSAQTAARKLVTVSVTGVGLLLALLGVFLAAVRWDVAGRARAEAEARSSEQQLLTTLQSIGDAVLATDARGLVTFLNPVAERLTGWSAPDALGQPVENVLRLRDEKSGQLLASPARSVIEEGAAVGLANHTTLIARNGTETPIADSGAPIRNDRGELSGAVLVFRDITEQRHAERAIQKLAAIVSSSEYAIIAETLDNVITDWNPGVERLFGFTASEMIGRRLADLAAPDAADPSPSATRQLLAGRRVVEFDARGQTKDGRWIDVVASLSPIRDDEGAIIGLSRLVRDVTERRRHSAELVKAKRRAEEANAAKDRFLATLSHELRTPLTPVVASLHRLEQRSDLGPGVSESLALIRRNVELEARLIDDLLDLTRIARGKLELDLAPQDLHAVVSSVVQSARSEFMAKSLELTVRLEATNPYCVGDAGRLQQVLWNVLRNSVKFTPAGGRVTISSENPIPERLRVRITDTGQGIRPGLLPHIFDAFEQGDTTAPRRAGGLGLGLAISKNLMDLHHGSIAAFSDGEGLGASFVIELATTDRRPERPSRPSAGQSTYALRGRTSLLLVEDDTDSREALHQLLLEEGFDARTAHSVASAEHSFREHPADVLVTDIGLPDGSGLDLLASLRKLRPDLRAIVLSGYGMEEDVQRSEALGFSAHFVKPLNLNRLIAAIDRLAAG